jgi:Co/Zn/Cd efflux system component
VIAEGRHLLVDVISSVGVLIGVLLAVRTGWFVLDPILAVIVAVYIIWSGWGLLKESIGGLMDESAAPEMLAPCLEWPESGRYRQGSGTGVTRSRARAAHHVVVPPLSGSPGAPRPGWSLR